MQIQPHHATVATMNVTPQCLYITDLQRTGDTHLRKVVAEGCAAGIDAVLLREPQMGSGKLLALASFLRMITREHHARLIIHSQADVALAIGADGVHLSASKISEATAIRRWLGAIPMTLSTSCHNAAELQLSLASGVDFALLSPVFTTDSHPETTALGIESFQQLVAMQSMPIIALGGITPRNRTQLNGYSIAAMRAIDEADDITRAVHLLIGNETAVA